MPPLATSISRFPDWPLRLDAFILENRNRPFRYGSWDCCLFVADSILAMTGIDLAADFRGRYFLRKEAFSLARAFSGTGTVQAVAGSVFRAAGILECLPSFAGRGDIVLTDKPRALGIVSLNGADVVVVRRRGLARVPIAEAVLAWKI